MSTWPATLDCACGCSGCGLTGGAAPPSSGCSLGRRSTAQHPRRHPRRWAIGLRRQMTPSTSAWMTPNMRIMRTADAQQPAASLSCPLAAEGLHRGCLCPVVSRRQSPRRRPHGRPEKGQMLCRLPSSGAGGHSLNRLAPNRRRCPPARF